MGRGVGRAEGGWDEWSGLVFFDPAGVWRRWCCGWCTKGEVSCRGVWEDGVWGKEPFEAGGEGSEELEFREMLVVRGVMGKRGRTSNGFSFAKPNIAANTSQEVNARTQTPPETLRGDTWNSVSKNKI